MSLFSFMVCAIAVSTVVVDAQQNLRVMTFNIWNSGGNVENGMEKIAEHIRLVDPDIVALQEVYEDVVTNLTVILGPPWKGISRNDSYPDAGILTKHEIDDNATSQTNWTIGTIIVISPSISVHFWSAHFNYRSYGPYAAFNKLVTETAQFMAGESTAINGGQGRVENTRELLDDSTFQQALQRTTQIPVLVCGDFNTPSHLDWTDKEKDIHGGWAFEWPVTKMLEQEAQLVDSFRKVHPDVQADPGYTWSTVEKMSGAGWSYTIPEPQDRIDFILYRSPVMIARSSYIYQGNETLTPNPNAGNNSYPSDHFAVVTDFEINVTRDNPTLTPGAGTNLAPFAWPYLIVLVTHLFMA